MTFTDEESRKNFFRKLEEAEKRHEDCERLAYLHCKADGKLENCGDRYYFEAHQKLAGFRWKLYKLHQPFIRLEKRVIEPLDAWADRANIFQFFSKISPIIEALGVLAIPFVILAFEVRQEKRQQQSEDRIISAQADIRQQQAVREYLSQVTNLYLESDQGKKLRENEELQKLLEANTLALLNELSIREDTRKDSDNDGESNPIAITLALFDELFTREDTFAPFKDIDTKRDHKGQIVQFLSDLRWINDREKKKPILYLEKPNLVGAKLGGAILNNMYLEGAYLEGAKLEGAKLEGAKLYNANLEEASLQRASLQRASLFRADLERADLYWANLEEASLEAAYLGKANLERADLERADLYWANLEGANLYNASLEGANLERVYLKGADLYWANLEGTNLDGAYLVNTKNLSNSQIKSACNWEKAVYSAPEFNFPEEISEFWWIGTVIDMDTQANQQKIREIKQDKASNPQKPPDCERFNKDR